MVAILVSDRHLLLHYSDFELINHKHLNSKINISISAKDSVTVFVNAIMYYKVKNAIHAVANVDDYSGSARLLAATTLRNVLGTMTLGDILCNREAIAKEMKVMFYMKKYMIYLRF